MSIELAQYRAVIGTFNLKPPTKDKSAHKYFDSHNPLVFNEGISIVAHTIFSICYFASIFWNISFSMVTTLYLISLCTDIHPHPGPPQTFGNLTFCHINIRSIKAENRLTAFLNQVKDKYDIISTSETWLTPTDSTEKFKINGYTGPYRLDRPIQRGGGLMVWVIDSIIAKERNYLSEPDLEMLWLQLDLPKAKILFGTCYRQADGTFGDNFWEKLQTSYDKAKQTPIRNLIMTGDFNAEAQTDRNAYDELQAFLALNHLYQHITEPTRITPTRASILDLIITNSPSLVTNVMVSAPVHLNDHCTISGEITSVIAKRKAYRRTMWCFKDADFNGFRQKLTNTDWEDCFDSEDPSQVCEKWTLKFKEISKLFVNSKTVTIRPNDKTWYNTYLRRLCRIKNRAHRTWVNHRFTENWDLYCIARNYYFDECDRIHLEHDEKLSSTLASEAKKNPKKWWNLAKEIMGNSKSSTYPSLVSNGTVYSTDEEKANLFNDSFLETSTLNAPPTATLDDDPTPDTDNELEFITIKEHDVKDILSTVNTTKAYGPDDLSPRLIKEAGSTIVKVLTRLFNLSLAKGIFPTMWKRANVLPIFKKAEQFFTTNYRPISLLCILAKFFEKIVFKYVFNYF